MRQWRHTRAALGILLTLLVTSSAAGCGATVDSGGLTAGDRQDAQTAMDALRHSNIPIQLVTITKTLQSVPAACRVRLVSKHPSTFKVYIFWIPYLGSESYIWLNMRLTADVARDRFHLETAQPVLPGGVLTPDGRNVEPWSLDTTLLSQYGPQQAKKNRQVLRAHAGDTFTKPGANCQLLDNGDLLLVPNR